MGKMESICSKLPVETRWQVMIDGANHFSFSDQMFTTEPDLIWFYEFVAAIPSRRTVAFTCQLILCPA
jgi:hypothetical protein